MNRPIAVLSPRIDLRPAECICGQDVDLVIGTHCPRCGTHLVVTCASVAA